MFRIKRLYVENYKLFSKKEIVFDDSDLFVFDGPNGYGKTSVFDAIELLITGKISRVKECESIDGKLKYQTVFFAKDNNSIVLFKAEFCSCSSIEDKETFVIGAKINPSIIKDTKSANPKNIYDNIDYYSLPSYDIPYENWEPFTLDKDSMNQKRIEKFGQHNIELFTLFHYIRQEDRLSYFKLNGNARSTIIDSLFGIESDKLKYDKIKSKANSIEKLHEKLTSDIKVKTDMLKNISQQENTKENYTPILEGIPEWDKEVISFGNSNSEELLSKYLNEINGLEEYCRYLDIHKIYYAYKMFEQIPDGMRHNTIKSLLLLQKESIQKRDIDSGYRNLRELEKQKSLIDSQRYLDVDYSKLFSIIDQKQDPDLINALQVLSNIAQSQDSVHKALTNVINIRRYLHEANSNIQSSGVCPYCGYGWANNEELEEHFNTTEKTLQKGLSNEDKNYETQRNWIKDRIDKRIYKSIIEKQEALKRNEIINAYSTFDSFEEFVKSTSNAKFLFQIIAKDLSEEFKELATIDEQCSEILGKCSEIGCSFSEQYLYAYGKYSFGNLTSKFRTNDEALRHLTKECFDKKRKYIQEQYYRSFDGLRKELSHLEEQAEIIGKAKEQLNAYLSAYKNAITAYKMQIFNNIEIPFFVYSSRLLQSYQGGQGVQMRIDENGTIRFTAQNSEHDILYTLSSGQLSAVLLAFSLALNKIYSGEGINTLLIDDPIQCMDDINMASFVELLQSEFSKCQIIMSTHEDDFSRYIRYKYLKCGLNPQSLSLKDA